MRRNGRKMGRFLGRYWGWLLLLLLSSCATSQAPSNYYDQGFYLTAIEQSVAKIDGANRMPNAAEQALIERSLAGLIAKVDGAGDNQTAKIAALKQIEQAYGLLQGKTYATQFAPFLQNPNYAPSALNARLAEAHYALGMSRAIQSPADQRWRVAIFKEGLAYGDYGDMRAQLARSEGQYRQAAAKGRVPGKIRVAIRYQAEGNYVEPLAPIMERTFNGLFEDERYLLNQTPFGQADLNIEITYRADGRVRREEERFRIGFGRGYYGFYDDSTPLYELYGSLKMDLYLTIASPFATTHREQYQLKADGKEFFYSNAYREKLFERLTAQIERQLHGKIYQSVMPYLERAEQRLLK